MTILAKLDHTIQKVTSKAAYNKNGLKQETIKFQVQVKGFLLPLHQNTIDLQQPGLWSGPVQFFQ